MERNEAFVLEGTFGYCQKILGLVNRNLFPKKGEEERGMTAFFSSKLLIPVLILSLRAIMGE
ncbi:hypothetical protein [Methylacidiphilum sp. Yel]|uniref:hypothetical protein n=1 Tax=Methylacidiphilum sp. Yel TaxID=1847730 RepID=UPI00106A2634|nr:hypothetical protein [Methylacidiphilum sp. Yel]